MVQIASVLEKVLLHRDKPPIFRALIYAAYIVPPVAVALLTWHEMTNTQMVWSSTEITRPHDAYEAEGEAEALASIVGATLNGGRKHWRPTKSYKAAFLSEFSKAYFQRPSRFEVFSQDMERASLTVILKNDASSRSILVNSVSAVAKLEDHRPFDWRDVDVSTGLMIRPGDWNGALDFINTGNGPILALNATLTGDDGWPFVNFVPELSLADELSMSLAPADESFVGPYVEDGNDLGETLYRVLRDDESMASQDAVIDCRPLEPIDGRCYDIIRGRYEEVTSVSRLAELTEIRRVSNIDVDYSYEDLKSVTTSGQKSISLGQPIYWYRQHERLLDALPIDPDLAIGDYSGDESAGSDFSYDQVGGFASGDVVQLAKKLFGVAVEGPKGVGLITTELDIDLAGMPECGFSQAIAEPRTLLQGEALCLSA